MDDDRHAGNRDGGRAGITRPGRAEYVPVRCPGYVSALYEAAGLRDVAEWNVDVELVTGSPAQYWEMISEHVSLAVAALEQVDDPARERIAKAVIAKVSTYEEDGKRHRDLGSTRTQVVCRCTPCCASWSPAASRRRSSQLMPPGCWTRSRRQGP